MPIIEVIKSIFNKVKCLFAFNKKNEEVIDSISGFGRERNINSRGEAIIINNDVKNVLLIGRSGNGKSALANVITETSEFKESSLSVSKTKEVQNKEFEKGKSKYCIIDTPGIGDTKMSDSEVLDIIAEAVYLVKDGLSQVLFVTNGRFDHSEMATYNLLRTIIFDKDITKYTTIVRTHFHGFREEEKCKIDVNKMIKESGELKEIVKSCQRRIVHVDDPSVEIEDVSEEELGINRSKRAKSREILLRHLSKTCQGESYKPLKLQELGTEIVDYMRKKEELEKELRKIKAKKVDNQVSKVKDSENISESSEDNKVELAAEGKKEQIGNNQVLAIKSDIDTINIEIEETITQLEDKKMTLKKQIEEKEKIIRQKVLKHIFNNYENITKMQGGNIFIDSIIGDNWKEINEEFSENELVVKWLNQGFDYWQVKRWANALGSSFNPNGACFYAWLRDAKKLSFQEVEVLSRDHNRFERLKGEYAEQLGEEVNILDRHNQQLNWRNDDQVAQIQIPLKNS